MLESGGAEEGTDGSLQTTKCSATQSSGVRLLNKSEARSLFRCHNGVHDYGPSQSCPSCTSSASYYAFYAQVLEWSEGFETESETAIRV
jgi:hypothetical protein